MLKGFSDRSLTMKVVDKNFPFVDDIPPDPEVPPTSNNKKKIGFSKKLVRDYKLDTDAAVLNRQLRELALMYVAQKDAPSPLNSRDKERRFKKISSAAIKLLTILDRLSVAENRQLSDVSGVTDLVGFKNQLGLVGGAAEQAEYSASKQKSEDRKDQAFYSMVWGMSELLPADSKTETKTRFLVECLDRLGVFADKLSDLQKFNKIRDLLRRNQKTFGN